mgnify:CR=1
MTQFALLTVQVQRNQRLQHILKLLTNALIDSESSINVAAKKLINIGNLEHNAVSVLLKIKARMVFGHYRANASLTDVCTVNVVLKVQVKASLPPH